MDTACSSSAYAIHLACQSLARGESTMALAGGVNLMLANDGFKVLDDLKALSPTNRCHTFSDDADGYVRGEGCGMLVLKPLKQAQLDGDKIYGTINASVANQDGRSNGLTAPNGTAQRALIQSTLTSAGLNPAQIG
ncbi:MAG: phthiocerol/phenolphthiocerol synthesis type-I polyketide synthase B [Paraglaciecola sp.]